MASTVEQIKAIIAKLPCVVESRVPYTYHHDFLRTYCSTYHNYSRTDIAKRNSGEYELYALALCEILCIIGVLDFTLMTFTDEDRAIIRECVNFAKDLCDDISLRK